MFAQRYIIHLLLTGCFFFPLSLLAQTQEFHLTLENHLFFPSVIEVPANKKVKLIIHNKDKVAEEFDSFDLNREKVIFAGKKSTVYIGPLPPGEYHFFGEYNPTTATGKVIVKEHIKETKHVD